MCGRPTLAVSFDVVQQTLRCSFLTHKFNISETQKSSQNKAIKTKINSESHRSSNTEIPEQREREREREMGKNVIY